MSIKDVMTGSGPLIDPERIKRAMTGQGGFTEEEWQESKRMMRETIKLVIYAATGVATGSQRYSQIAPTAAEEQKTLALPFAIHSPPTQNSAGLIYFVADIDMPDDDCHPVGP